MSRMLGILILSYRLKEVKNFYVLHCFELQRILHIFATTCPIEMGYRSKCSIFAGQVFYFEKSKLNIADMWLSPLDRVTNSESSTGWCSDLVWTVVCTQASKHLPPMWSLTKTVCTHDHSEFCEKKVIFKEYLPTLNVQDIYWNI